MDLETKKQLICVMKEEDALLDKILMQQTILHKNVTDKNWEELNKNIVNLQVLSDEFVSLEEKRVSIGNDKHDMNDNEYSDVLGSLRNKLNKSKVENHVLNEYVTTTRKFLQGVFDKAVPQRRNILYSRNGNLVKQEPNSLVINQVI